MEKRIENNPTAMVEVPVLTLNAIKAMLFSKEGGVDMSGIIEDLGGDDVTAINVALAFNHARIDVDRRDRFRLMPGKSGYKKYEFLGYSLIKNEVKANESYIYFESKTEHYVEVKTMSYEKWLNLDTESPVQESTNPSMEEESFDFSCKKESE